MKWHWPHIAFKRLCHLNSLCVMLQTSTHEGFFHLESGLWYWALLNHWVVVGVLGGHLKSLRYMYKMNWNVVTFNSPEACRSKVDTRSWGTPASSSSFTQMCVLSALIQLVESQLPQALSLENPGRKIESNFEFETRLLQQPRHT